MRRLLAIVALSLAIGTQAQTLVPSPDTTSIGYDLVRDRILVDFQRVAVNSSAGFVVFVGRVSLRGPSAPDSMDMAHPALTPFVNVEASYQPLLSSPPRPPVPPPPPPGFDGPPRYSNDPPPAVASSRVLRGGRFRVALPIDVDRLEEWVPELFFRVSIPGFGTEVRGIHGEVGLLPLARYYRFSLS